MKSVDFEDKINKNKNIENTSSSRKKKSNKNIQKYQFDGNLPNNIDKTSYAENHSTFKGCFYFHFILFFFQAQDRVGRWGCSAFEYLTSSLHNSQLRDNVFDFTMDLPVTIMAKH